MGLPDSQQKLDMILDGIRDIRRVQVQDKEDINRKITIVEQRLAKHSGFMGNTDERASKAGDRITDLTGAVMTQFGVMEKRITALQMQVTKDTKGQNVELAGQTATLENFRLTPRMTILAAFVGTAGGTALIKIFQWIGAHL